MYVNDVRHDQEYVLTVNNTVDLYKYCPADYPDKNMIIGQINPATNIPVYRIRYGKDFMTFKVVNQNKRMGWITYSESNFTWRIRD